MRCGFIAAIGLVGFVGTADAGLLIDFGTEGGYGGQLNAPGNAWTGTYGGTPSAAFTNDAGQISFSPTGAWQSQGMMFGGWGGSYLDRVAPFGAVAGSDFLAMEARILLGSPAPDFFRINVLLKAADGSESLWHFISTVQATPTPFSYGTDASTTPYAVVKATTDIANPITTANGGFDFASDEFDTLHIQYQNANSGVLGTIVLDIDNIQTVAVPEPASLALLAIGGVAMLRRRG